MNNVPAPPPPTPGFMFDFLPAPMRNQIYDLLLPHTPFTPPGFTHPIVAMNRNQILEAAEMTPFANMTPLVRFEMFRKLELSMEHRPVPFALLQDYLDHWVAANPTRDLRLDININRAFANARVTVDMYPAMMKCRRNPRSRLRVRAEGTNYTTAQNALANPAAHPLTSPDDARRVIKLTEFLHWSIRTPPRGRQTPLDRRRWYTFFGNAAQRLDLQFQVNNDCLEILLKRNQTPDWMISGSRSRDRRATWVLQKYIDEWRPITGLLSFPRVTSAGSTAGWRTIEVRGSGYNVAAAEQ